MKFILRALLALTVFLTVAVVAAAKRKSLLEFALKSYAKKNGIPLALSVTELTPKRLILHGVKIGKRTLIPELDLEFHSLLDLSIKSVRLDLHSIDPSDFSSGESEVEEIAYFQSASSACEIIRPMNLDLTFGDLQIGGVSTNVRLRLKKQAESTVLQIDRRLEDRFQKLMDLQIECGAKEISAKTAEIPISNIPYSISTLSQSTKVKRFEVSLNENNAVQAKILLTDLSVAGTYPLQMSELSLIFSSDALPDSKGAGFYYFRGFNMQGEKGQKLAEDLRGDGKIVAVNQVYDMTFNLKNADGKLLLPEAKIEYLGKLQKAKVSFSPQKIQIDSQIKKSFPPLKQWVEEVHGEYSLSGRLFYEKEFIRPNLHLQMALGRLKTESAELAGTRIEYLVGPRIDSGNGKVSVASLQGAVQIDDLASEFKVKNQKTVVFEKIEARMEKADLSLTSFELDLESYTTTSSNLRIDRLSLEKILKLFLKDAVAAEGMLSGSANFYLKKGLPIIADGRLRANGAGWIRYRPPGAQPPPAKETLATTATPIEILNHYLYDFSYQNLEMDFSTDEDLVLRMTLRALGNNPPYRQGQALKLNVNLQENLLPVVKSVLLTQSLPEKLKQKMQKIGN